PTMQPTKRRLSRMKSNSERKDSNLFSDRDPRSGAWRQAWLYLCSEANIKSDEPMYSAMKFLHHNGWRAGVERFKSGHAVPPKAKMLDGGWKTVWEGAAKLGFEAARTYAETNNVEP